MLLEELKDLIKKDLEALRKSISKNSVNLSSEINPIFCNLNFEEESETLLLHAKDVLSFYVEAEEMASPAHGSSEVAKVMSLFNILAKPQFLNQPSDINLLVLEEPSSETVDDLSDECFDLFQQSVKEILENNRNIRAAAKALLGVISEASKQMKAVETFLVERNRQHSLKLDKEAHKVSLVRDYVQILIELCDINFAGPEAKEKLIEMNKIVKEFCFFQQPNLVSMQCEQSESVSGVKVKKTSSLPQNIPAKVQKSKVVSSQNTSAAVSIKGGAMTAKHQSSRKRHATKSASQQRKLSSESTTSSDQSIASSSTDTEKLSVSQMDETESSGEHCCGKSRLNLSEDELQNPMAEVNIRYMEEKAKEVELLEDLFQMLKIYQTATHK